ncbi:PQQ-like beta-propeller repeat protein [Chloroflexi bacterium TSY]|nr:PQQ-like beta-propeller repeat protein [Chloroflexi bacterium TSY]
MLSESGEPAGFAIHGLKMSSREILWTNTRSVGIPFVQDGVVYYGGIDGTLHGQDLMTGVEVWRLGREES